MQSASDLLTVVLAEDVPAAAGAEYDAGEAEVPASAAGAAAKLSDADAADVSATGLEDDACEGACIISQVSPAGEICAAWLR